MLKTVRILGSVSLLALLASAQPRLQYVTTAHQLGPVNYRDPLGVISPSGEWLAYSIAQHLYVERVAGGPVKDVGDVNKTPGGLDFNYGDCIGCGLCILGCPAYEETGFDLLTARGRNKALQSGLDAQDMVEPIWAR